MTAVVVLEIEYACQIPDIKHGINTINSNSFDRIVLSCGNYSSSD